ncbi:hypothetical protein GCM10010519_72870 [Streptomyces lactacystinicus]
MPRHFFGCPLTVVSTLLRPPRSSPGAVGAGPGDGAGTGVPALATGPPPKTSQILFDTRSPRFFRFRAVRTNLSGARAVIRRIVEQTAMNGSVRRRGGQGRSGRVRRRELAGSGR